MHRIIVLAVILWISPVEADSHLTDIRCCVEVKRYADGRIVRSQAVVRAFEKMYPLPEGESRDDWQINHAVPLACGGKDIVSNLIWMRKEAKTCADDWCQDRHERLTMCPGK